MLVTIPLNAQNEIERNSQFSPILNTALLLSHPDIPVHMANLANLKSIFVEFKGSSLNQKRVIVYSVIDEAIINPPANQVITDTFIGIPFTVNSVSFNDKENGVFKLDRTQLVNQFGSVQLDYSVDDGIVSSDTLLFETFAFSSSPTESATLLQNMTNTAASITLVSPTLLEPLPISVTRVQIPLITDSLTDTGQLVENLSVSLLDSGAVTVLGTSVVRTLSYSDIAQTDPSLAAYQEFVFTVPVSVTTSPLRIRFNFTSISDISHIRYVTDTNVIQTGNNKPAIKIFGTGS